MNDQPLKDKPALPTDSEIAAQPLCRGSEAREFWIFPDHIHEVQIFSEPLWENWSKYGYVPTHVIEYSALTEAQAERDEALERVQITSDTNKLKQMTIHELQEQRDSLKREVDALDKAYTSVSKEVDRVVKERDACLAECERLVAALNQLRERSMDYKKCNGSVNMICAEVLENHDRWMKERDGIR